MELPTGVQCTQKKSDSILEKNWSKNDVDVKDDPYKALVLTYSREMDQLVEANIISSKMEEENYETPIWRNDGVR